MPAKRKRIPIKHETALLVQSLRRCCLCFALERRVETVKGQIAHIDRDRSNNAFENLAWLCFEHHDEYDSRPSQSKRYTPGELRTHRNALYLFNEAEAPDHHRPVIDFSEAAFGADPYALARKAAPKEFERIDRRWRYPMWQVTDLPELFAYTTRHGADGICLVETIPLPDGRIVVACMDLPGNPGRSITNAVEELCFQVCETFEIPPEVLVWLECYPGDDVKPWNMISFASRPPLGLFAEPQWTEMTAERWHGLRLRPKANSKLRVVHGQYQSLLRKMFIWQPGEPIILPGFKS